MAIPIVSASHCRRFAHAGRSSLLRFLPLAALPTDSGELVQTHDDVEIVQISLDFTASDRHPLALRAAATSRPPGRIRGRAVPTVTICSPSASFEGVSKSRQRPTCREWPQRSPNRQFVNRPTLAEVPLTGLPFHSDLNRS